MTVVVDRRVDRRVAGGGRVSATGLGRVCMGPLCAYGG